MVGLAFSTMGLVYKRAERWVRKRKLIKILDRNIEKRKLIQERHGCTDGGKKENLKGTKLKKVKNIRKIKLISSLGIQREKNSQRQSKIIGRDNDDSEWKIG